MLSEAEASKGRPPLHPAPMSTAAPTSPVRLALVGLGGHGRTIQHAADAAPGVAVVGVYDPDEAEAALAAERFGVDAAVSYEALLATPGLDAVALTTPNALHRAQAEAAFARGLDVFVEKPIAHTLADGAAMIAAADAAGRVLFVGHNMRYGAPAAAARAALADGRIGTLVSFEVHFSSDTGTRLAPGSWRLRAADAPLLPVAQLGIHGLDLVHALLGPTASVGARARAVGLPAGAPGDVVDSVVALVALDGGVLGTLVSHYCTPVRFAWTITGTSGALDGTPHTLVVTSCDAAPETLVDVRGDGYESYVAEMAAFADAVRTRRTPESDGRSGLLALAVVDAMRTSVASGGMPVTVDVGRTTNDGRRTMGADAHDGAGARGGPTRGRV